MATSPAPTPSFHATPRGDLTPILSADATLRDLFAAHALAGLCTPQASVSLGTADQIAQMAYRVADALLSLRDPVPVAPV